MFQMLYLFSLLSNSQILVSVMLANRRIASLLFSWFDLMGIMMSSCYEVAKVYLTNLRITSDFLNGENILSIFFLAGQIKKQIC